MSTLLLQIQNGEINFSEGYFCSTLHYDLLNQEALTYVNADGEMVLSGVNVVPCGFKIKLIDETTWRYVRSKVQDRLVTPFFAFLLLSVETVS